VRPLAGDAPAAYLRLHGRAIFGFTLPFALVLYLALRGGGYDPIIRGEFGLVVWAIVLGGASVGALSTAGWTRAAWLLAGLFGAFAMWTGLAVIWSDSVEKTLSEFARVATYGGVLALGLTFGTREDFKRTVAGVATALALVALIALASRLHPAWFPKNEAADILPETIKRLNYPVGYWNGLAALVAVGIPLVLWLAADAARTLVRAVAAAAVPVMSLTAYMTLSRGGVIEIAVALIVFIALHPRRLELLPTLANSALGALVLIYLASQREDLSNGLSTATAATQADQMIVAVLAVAIAVGLIEAGIREAGVRGIGPRPEISRPTALRLAAIGAAVIVIGAVAAGAPGRVSHAWAEFKSPSGPEAGDTLGRFSSASGNGRYQYWSASVDAGKDEPLVGIGPGTWEFYWAQHGTLPGFVRDAHSLYLETFAELGLPGLLLICSIVGLAVVAAVRRALRADASRRIAASAAAASIATFATAAALDWSWELPVIPIAVMLILGAVLTAERDLVAFRERASIDRRWALAGAALVGVAAVALPLPGAIAIRDSQESFNSGKLQQAINRARTAEDLEPWGAAPHLQEALVLEQAGRLQEAQAAATEAVNHESANWRNWYVLARLDSHLGLAAEASQAFDTVRELNPRSVLLSSGAPQ
jgi:hypothetical protein